MKKTAILILLSTIAVLGADPIETAIQHEGRSEKDLERDHRSHPEEVLKLLGVENGDVIADVFGGSGYYSELLSYLVGPEGKVILHNNKAYMPYVQEDLVARLKGDRLPNVIRHDREADQLDLKASSLDAVLMIMSYHDIYFVSDEWKIDGKGLFKQLREALKPGGKLLIVDHSGRKGTAETEAQKLHRIDEDFAKKDIASNGFKLIGESQVLRNSEDDLTKSVFEKGIRGKTDRFVLLFEKL